MTQNLRLVGQQQQLKQVKHTQKKEKIKKKISGKIFVVHI